MNKLTYLLASFALAATSACGGDDANPTVDLSTHDQAVASNPDLASHDLATNSIVQSCGVGDYADLTAASATRTITPWDQSLGKKCFKIAAGQSVTWNPTPSGLHPLMAIDGTTPSPIPSSDTSVGMYAFPNVGIYGFQCANHTSMMHGAIWVVP